MSKLDSKKLKFETLQLHVVRKIPIQIREQEQFLYIRHRLMYLRIAGMLKKGLILRIAGTYTEGLLILRRKFLRRESLLWKAERLLSR